MATIKPPLPKKPVGDPQESRVAWFCVLDRAREKGDEVLEAKAIYHLRRLGVRIAYDRSARSRGTR